MSGLGLNAPYGLWFGLAVVLNALSLHLELRIQRHKIAMFARMFPPFIIIISNILQEDPHLRSK